MNFIPEEKLAEEVPFFDDVTSQGGWQGHETSKSLNKLKAEVTESLTRLGAVVTGFQRGTFYMAQKREGFQIHYLIPSESGPVVKGRLDIAALPIKEDRRLHRSLAIRRQKSLKMALYMLRMALDGQWFLRQLSPGYAPLMPWMLVSENKTVSQAWSESRQVGNLLPAPGDDDFVEGDYREI